MRRIWLVLIVGLVTAGAAPKINCQDLPDCYAGADSPASKPPVTSGGKGSGSKEEIGTPAAHQPQKQPDPTAVNTKKETQGHADEKPENPPPCVSAIIWIWGWIVALWTTFWGWTLDQKIATLASVAAFLQFAALLVTIRVMINSSRRQLRAYVFIENAWARRTSNGDRWHVIYRLRNNGNTPSHKTIVRHVARIVDGGLKTLPVPDDETYLGSVAPNGDFIDMETDTVGPVADHDITTEGKAIALCGRIDYLDVFGKPRWTKFCHVLTGNIPSDGEMDVHETGNDSN